MTETKETSVYNVQSKVSKAAQDALHIEQARRRLAGQKLKITDIAAEIIEKWAATAA